jgi:hypothetical protein
VVLSANRDVSTDNGDKTARGDADDTMRRGEDDVGLDERATTAVIVRRVGQAQGDHEAV